MEIRFGVMQKLVLCLLLIGLVPAEYAVGDSHQTAEESSEMAELYRKWQLRDGDAFWGLVPELYAALFQDRACARVVA